MQLLVQGLVFFVIVGALWYVFLTRQIWGLGSHIKSKKEAVMASGFFAVIATLVFTILNTTLF